MASSMPGSCKHTTVGLRVRKPPDFKVATSQPESHLAISLVKPYQTGNSREKQHFFFQIPPEFIGTVFMCCAVNSARKLSPWSLRRICIDQNIDCGRLTITKSRRKQVGKNVDFGRGKKQVGFSFIKHWIFNAVNVWF